MNQLKPTAIFLTIMMALCSAAAAAAPASLTVHLDKVEHAISPTLHGIFFEDINFGGDGGLCPELVKNGSFEFTPDPLMGWHRIDPLNNTSHAEIGTDHPLNENNPHYLRFTAEWVDVLAPRGQGSSGLTNEGFRGMGVSKDADFIFSFYARSAKPIPLSAALIDSKGNRIGGASVDVNGSDWKKYSAQITSSKTDAHAHLQLDLGGVGSMDLDMISLYPASTFNNHGLRTDLVQLLKDLHPKFMRFPGGCIVEGRTLESRYQWKNTIGDPSERKLIVDRWNSEFNWRPTPDYFQSYRLGFYEYFQLCEDIGATPLPLVNCGMACQFNTGELAPMDQLEPYVQDALDLVEFANGPVDSQWGKKRAEMGHPASFNLKRIGIGNEQWGPHYVERYAKMSAALKAKYPEIEIVAAAGPSPDGPLFDYAWKELSALHADILDEHYYANPDWFINHADRYDHYPRNGPKVFAGEFAAQSVAIASPNNKNNWRCALAEAAFITGLERNSDLVVMSSYAPLFAHVDAWQWTPNLIWFDNLKSFGTPNYYVQELYGANTGNVLLAQDVAGDSKGLFITSSRDDAADDVILKIVNTEAAERPMHIELTGQAISNSTATAQVLASDDLETQNSINEPAKLSPAKNDMGAVGSTIETPVPGSSFTVIRIHSAK